MKFSLLAIGDRFEMKGEVYTKTSPFIAQHGETGASKMVPRSTNVRPLDAKEGVADTARQQTGQAISPEHARAALDQLHNSCSICLDVLSADLSGAAVGEARERLAQAYRTAAGMLQADH